MALTAQLGPEEATTRDFANIGNFTPKVFSQKSAISLPVPGSCWPKSLEGKPSTTRPR